jgi:hypothetical protein
MGTFPKFSENWDDEHTWRSHHERMKKELTSAKITGLRDKLTELAERFLPEIEDVVLNGKPITMQQVQLIRAVLGKVVPDVSATAVLHSGSVQSKIFLSREELENLVAEQNENRSVFPPSEGFNSSPKAAETVIEHDAAGQVPVSVTQLPRDFVRRGARKRVAPDA